MNYQVKLSNGQPVEVLPAETETLQDGYDALWKEIEYNEWIAKNKERIENAHFEAIELPQVQTNFWLNFYTENEIENYDLGGITGIKFHIDNLFPEANKPLSLAMFRCIGLWNAIYWLSNYYPNKERLAQKVEIEIQPMPEKPCVFIDVMRAGATGVSPQPLAYYEQWFEVTKAGYMQGVDNYFANNP
jgi:hypothetical protein